MKILAARLSGNELCLRLQQPSDAAKFVYQFTEGDYEINKTKRKRSLDANAYCWVLIHKIAEAVQEPPKEIYRRYIRDIGCKTHIVCVRVGDVETEVETFLAGHIGRMVEIGDSKIPGCATIHKKYGSSSFDVSQMAAFIDQISQDCTSMGIEVRPQEEIDSLLRQWGENDGR